LTEKLGLGEWEAIFTPEMILEVTSKTGQLLAFE